MFRLIVLGIVFALQVGGSVAVLAQSSMQKAREYLAVRDFQNAAPHLVAAAKESPKNMQILLLTGDAFTELQKPDSALIYYKRALDVNDENLEALRKYALSLAETTKISQALEIMRDANEIDDENVYNYLTLGQIYIKADSLVKADFAIRKAQRIDDAVPETFVALGDLYYAQRVFELAKTNYEKALELDPTLVESRIKLARAYWRLASSSIDRATGNELFKQSLIHWDAVTKQDTNNAPAFFEKGKILFLSGEHKPAAIALMRYAHLRPDGALGRWYLGQSLYEINKTDSAIVHLEFVRKNIDSVADKAAIMLARTYFRAREFGQATKMFGELEQKMTLDGDDLERYGRSAILAGDTATALVKIKQAIEQQPEKCKLALMLGNLLVGLKDYNQAIEVFNTQMANCEDEPAERSRVLYFVGVSHYSNNNVTSAIVSLKKSLELDPANYYAWSQLGSSYSEQDKQDSAATAFNKAIAAMKADTANVERLDRRIDAAYQQLSLVWYKKKEFNELKRVCREWAEFSPESANAYLFMAIAAQSLEDKDGACANYRKALKLDPGLDAAKKNLQALGCP